MVNKALQWNSGRESQMIKWKETESKLILVLKVPHTTDD